MIGLGKLLDRRVLWIALGLLVVVVGLFVVLDELDVPDQVRDVIRRTLLKALGVGLGLLALGVLAFGFLPWWGWALVASGGFLVAGGWKGLLGVAGLDDPLGDLFGGLFGGGGGGSDGPGGCPRGTTPAVDANTGRWTCTPV